MSTAGPRYNRSIIVIDSPTMNETMKSTNDAAPMVIVFSMTLMQTSIGAINKLSHSMDSSAIEMPMSQKYRMTMNEYTCWLKTGQYENSNKKL